jgi:hypothetical protein
MTVSSKKNDASEHERTMADAMELPRKNNAAGRDAFNLNIFVLISYAGLEMSPAPADCMGGWV